MKYPETSNTWEHLPPLGWKRSYCGGWFCGEALDWTPDLGRGTQPTCYDSLTPQGGSWGIYTPGSLTPIVSSPFRLLAKSNLKPKKGPIQICKDTSPGAESRVGKGGEWLWRDKWKIFKMVHGMVYRTVSFPQRNRYLVPCKTWPSLFTVISPIP